MAINGNQLGSEIAEAIMHSDAPPDVQVEVIKLWQKIGAAIVSHIVDNAEVPAGIAVSTSGGGGSTTAPGKVT
jgi:hypothetical protein